MDGNKIYSNWQHRCPGVDLLCYPPSDTSHTSCQPHSRLTCSSLPPRVSRTNGRRIVLPSPPPLTSKPTRPIDLYQSGRAIAPVLRHVLPTAPVAPPRLESPARPQAHLWPGHATHLCNAVIGRSEVDSRSSAIGSKCPVHSELTAGSSPF